MDDQPNTFIIAARFPLGAIVATPGAEMSLTPEEIGEGLTRHARGDWGDLCPEDREENEFSLKKGYRLFSVYTATTSKTRFYVITEADRSVTTVLLPSEY